MAAVDGNGGAMNGELLKSKWRSFHRDTRGDGLSFCLNNDGNKKCWSDVRICSFDVGHSYNFSLANSLRR